MDQTVFNLWRPLCDFLRCLLVVGYWAGQKPQQASPIMLQEWNTDKTEKDHNKMVIIECRA